MLYLKIAGLAVLASIIWIVFVVYGTLSGWWHEAITEDPSPAAFLAAAQTLVEDSNVGNVAFVLIEEGEVFAEYFVGKSQDIDRDTLFPTASMSKWITALAVMRLVENGQLELDRPVSAYLSRWQLPASDFGNEGVTIRRLLSHTSGLTDGLGFGDYASNEQLPSLEQSLANPRASSSEEVQIALGRTPGSEWDYSGGGYLILQLVIEEVAGQSFSQHIQESLLDPVGMSRSTYGFLGDENNRSNSYRSDGAEAAMYQYAASAATGFASSASDLTRLVQALLKSAAAPVIAAETLALMRKPEGSMYGIDIWGLGTILYARNEAGDFVFGHDGQNEPAINSAVRINPGSNDAIVVLASGNKSLATKLGFEWVYWQTGTPDFLGVGYLVEKGKSLAGNGLGLIWLAALLVGGYMRKRRSEKTG